MRKRQKDILICDICGREVDHFWNERLYSQFRAEERKEMRIEEIVLVSDDTLTNDTIEMCEQCNKDLSHLIITYRDSIRNAK